MKKQIYIGGDPEYRKEKWRDWWEAIGRFKDRARPIKLPKESDELAEFTGIALGDGGISKYQVTITLNSITDKLYGKFVVELINRLFGINPSISPRRDRHAVNIVVSRRALVRFCGEKLGLPVWHKIRHQIDIPSWIKMNKSYSAACVRGLVDTDGSIFSHRYRVGRKLYSYKKLDFTSRSFPLCLSVFQIFRSFGIHPRLARNKSVRIDSKDDMKKYFTLIGSHNPKHLNRYFK